MAKYIMCECMQSCWDICDESIMILTNIKYAHTHRHTRRCRRMAEWFVEVNRIQKRLIHRHSWAAIQNVFIIEMGAPIHVPPVTQKRYIFHLGSRPCLSLNGRGLLVSISFCGWMCACILFPLWTQENKISAQLLWVLIRSIKFPSYRLTN